MRTLLRLMAILLVVMGLAASPALASSDVLVSKKDPKGDAKIYKSKKLTTAQKKSIDVDKVSLTYLPNGKYRLKVSMKKLYASKKWDQIVIWESSFNFGVDPEEATAYFKVRNSGGAQAYNSATGRNCPLKVKRGSRSVWVDIPSVCMGVPGQKLRLTTYAGHYQSDAPPYARDRVTVGRLPAQQ